MKVLLVMNAKASPTKLKIKVTEENSSGGAGTFPISLKTEDVPPLIGVGWVPTPCPRDSR